MEIYNIYRPESIQVPIVLSVPHCGSDFPPHLADQYHASMLPPDDTDWDVDRLYDFASSIGMVMIAARISRWVIDLNRNPDGKPLYNDGRVITALCPATNFMGEKLYTDGREKVSQEETTQRRQQYFDPYHHALQQLLDEVKGKFGKVLLWDCHSIRRNVPAIRPVPFPDLILGSADGQTAPADVAHLAASTLASHGYNIQQNDPFKGGYITRHYGRPEQNQHALQLEMTKDLYMDDSETVYDETRADAMRHCLQNTFVALQAIL